MGKPTRTDDDIGIYLDVDWERTYVSRWLDARVELALYKGRVILSVESDAARAKALATHAGIVVGGRAWMRITDIDEVIKLLRAARRVLKMHQSDIRQVAACRDCRSIFAGVCARHRRLFKKYKKPKQSRGVR